MCAHKSRTAAFTNRGLHFGNLWEVFSYKKKQRITLISDLELCYWLLFLEFDCIVRGYEIRPPGKIVSDPKPHKLFVQAEVSRTEGAAWHLLFPNENFKNERSYLDALAISASYDVELKVYTRSDIVPHKYKIFPLLKVVSCLAAGKGSHAPYDYLDHFRAYAKKMGSGVLIDFYIYFYDCESALINYAVAELFSLGELKITLAPNFFSENTEWVYP